jgi:hypothetical protein
VPRGFGGGLKSVWNSYMCSTSSSVAGALLFVVQCVRPTVIGGNAPNFIVTPQVTTYPVPNGATGPDPADNGRGMQFQGGSGGNGMDPRTSGFRYMDPVTSGQYQYPNGYGSYNNASGQTVNPYTGQTVAPSNPMWHIPNGN